MFRISRMNRGSWGKIRAFFDLEVTVNHQDKDVVLTLKGFKLVDGVNGLFVGFPSEKKKGEDEYQDTIWADKDTKGLINQVAHTEYEKDVPVGEPADEDIPF